MKEIKVKAPAKINLGLHVISKRDDGYHNIETIFYPIELYDVLTFKKADDFVFSSNNDELNQSPDNLVVKAKNLLEEHTKQKITVHIYLEKNIPVGGGLGGGSSNAASVLTSLNELFKLQIDYTSLKSLALRLGSDIPFFLKPEPCYGSSRGESLEYRALKISYPILIVNPGIHISTKWAYSKIIPKTPAFNLKDFTQEHLEAPNKLAKFLRNDFEDMVFDKYPEVKNLKEELSELGALFVLMSGSGSTIYSIFKGNSAAEKAVEDLSPQYFTFLQKSKEKL
jgi:4-diphosphocytidyl-2-C-methyl-D-erythritol kinase